MRKTDKEIKEACGSTAIEDFEKRYPSLVNLFKSLQASDDREVSWETIAEGANIEVDQREP